jgi:DNA invertase Pin-like site-specific DNA recombinase
MADLLGYARISTGDQHPDLQVDALEAAGCYRVFVDTASGALAARPALDQLLDQLRPGDTLVVTLLYMSSRGGRMLVDLP